MCDARTVIEMAFMIKGRGGSFGAIVVLNGLYFSSSLLLLCSEIVSYLCKFLVWDSDKYFW